MLIKEESAGLSIEIKAQRVFIKDDRLRDPSKLFDYPDQDALNALFKQAERPLNALESFECVEILIPDHWTLASLIHFPYSEPHQIESLLLFHQLEAINAHFKTFFVTDLSPKLQPQINKSWLNVTLSHQLLGRAQDGLVVYFVLAVHQPLLKALKALMHPYGIHKVRLSTLPAWRMPLAPRECLVQINAYQGFTLWSQTRPQEGRLCSIPPKSTGSNATSEYWAAFISRTLEQRKDAQGPLILSGLTGSHPLVPVLKSRLCPYAHTPPHPSSTQDAAALTDSPTHAPQWPYFEVSSTPHACTQKSSKLNSWFATLITLGLSIGLLMKCQDLRTQIIHLESIQYSKKALQHAIDEDQSAIEHLSAQLERLNQAHKLKTQWPEFLKRLQAHLPDCIWIHSFKQGLDRDIYHLSGLFLVEPHVFRKKGSAFGLNQLKASLCRLQSQCPLAAFSEPRIDPSWSLKPSNAIPFTVSLLIP